MLRITIPAKEFYDERSGEFVEVKEHTIELEHSLISVSKWESRHHKAFLGKAEKTPEELLSYVMDMTITRNVAPEVYLCLTEENVEEINRYISDSMTATTINEIVKTGPSGEKVITAELIYYWMIAQNIPFECQKWHLNRLITLIKVCSIKNNPPKKGKISRSELASQRRTLNAQRQAQLGTKG